MDVEWLSPKTREPLRRGYAVRVEPNDGLLAPYDIDGQYRLHRAVLDHSDVPMADLYWLEPDASVLGMPFYVMERCGVVRCVAR
jgi:aminoglycoside phosphotransferase (APT) family kinase protein